MEHKKKIWLKGILAVALFVMVFITYLSPVFAEINVEYFSSTGATQEDVDAATKDNTLLSPIGGFVYIIGNIIEWLLSSVSSAATGMNTMPWADMILYNSVAMLDVNFLNPNENSLIYGMQGIIQKVYFTIFSLAISFFGIAVVVMAIKLAISSIAEEKAKYKSAITSWLMAVVLLFTIHYFMAFVFYLNESVVNLASKIAVDSVSGSGLELGDAGMEGLKNLMLKVMNGKDSYDGVKGRMYKYICVIYPVEKYIGNDGNYTLKNGKTADYDPGYSMIIRRMFLQPNSNFSKWIYNTENLDADFMTGFNKATYTGVMNANSIITMASSISQWYNDYPEFLDAHNKYLNDTSNKENKESYINLIAKPISAIDFKMYRIDTWINNAWSGDIAKIRKKLSEEDSFFEFSEAYLEYMGIYYNYRNSNSTDSNSEINGNIKESTASLIASYFKSQAWGVNKDTLQTTDANVTFCFLYTIFVIQSLLYFFAYIKRFFYIIVLALMAPVVVVYDFVSKI